MILNIMGNTMLNERLLWIKKISSTKLNNSFFGALLSLTILLLYSANNNFAQPLASGKDKFIGNVISNGYSIRPDFSKYWNQVTPENAGKWGSAEPTQGNFNWTQLDS